eukprot:6250666-Prymnesium_polylepis.1
MLNGAARRSETGWRARGVEQQMFACGMTRHRFDVIFVAECAVYSARVAVLHHAGEVWRGGRLASDSAAQDERAAALRLQFHQPQ